MSENIIHRILIVDDNINIHEDYKKIIENINIKEESNLEKYSSELFGSEKIPDSDLKCQVDSAYQGEEALALVEKSIQSGKHYELAFIDIRMPPGIDGVETAEKIMQMDENIQIVICTAYGDFIWQEINNRLGKTDRYLILKKPFDRVEVLQLISTLTKKRDLNNQIKKQMANLEDLILERTKDLEKASSFTKATLESCIEGIFAINRENKIIEYNQKMLDIWNIPIDFFKLNNFNELIKLMRDQVNNQEDFENKFNSIYQAFDGQLTEKWHLKNKKIIEFYTQPQSLGDEIIGRIFCFRDITEKHFLEEQLIFQATHDYLTGLPNRALISEQINKAILLADKNNLHLAVIVFDLDKFKSINDNYGHDVGDLLLQKISVQLSSILRKQDTIARLGGDEFALVILSKDLEEFNQVIYTYIKAITHPLQLGDRSIEITTSMGISLYPRNGRDVATLLKNADLALYNVKETGRNGYQFTVHNQPETEI